MRLHKNYIQRYPVGFRYLTNFITQSEKQELLRIIDGNTWDQTIKRRQQHYGITYYQTSHLISTLQPVDPVQRPAYPLRLFQFIIDRLITHGLFNISNPPNQCLVNEYVKSSHLSMHIEDKSSFGQVICGLSLGGPEWLRLQHSITKQEARVLLEDISLYALTGESRDLWKHGIGRNNEGEDLTIEFDIQTRAGDPSASFIVNILPFQS